MKRFRALGWMFLVTFVLFLINKGRSYYTAPAYVMLLAAGCVWFEGWLEARTEKMRQLGFGLLWGTQVIGSLIAIILMKPIAPINSPSGKSPPSERGIHRNGRPAGSHCTGAGIYQSIPEVKGGHGDLNGNYGEGAFDLYGDEYRLPAPLRARTACGIAHGGGPETRRGWLEGAHASPSNPVNSVARSRTELA
jgi:hypothetical protein